MTGRTLAQAVMIAAGFVVFSAFFAVAGLSLLAWATTNEADVDRTRMLNALVVGTGCALATLYFTFWSVGAL